MLFLPINADILHKMQTFIQAKSLANAISTTKRKKIGSIRAPDCVKLELFYLLPLYGVGLATTEDENLAVANYLN